MLGITFPQELEAAGLLGLNIMWNEYGIISHDLNPEQEARLNEVVAAHDYAKAQALAECYAKRKAGYGSIEDQIDYLIHNGADALIARNKAIKTQFPKP